MPMARNDIPPVPASAAPAIARREQFFSSLKNCLVAKDWEHKVNATVKPNIETIEADALKSAASDAASLTAQLVALFVDEADTDERTYSKSLDLWSLKSAHGVTGVAVIESIKSGLVAAGRRPELAPTAGKLSHFRGAWQMLLDADIDPTGEYALVADAKTAKAGRFLADDIDLMIVKVKSLAPESRKGAMHEYLTAPSTKGDKLAAKRAAAAAEKLAADAADDVAAADVVKMTLAEMLTDALSRIGVMPSAALADAADAAETFAMAARAALSARPTDAVELVAA